jgi:hypothetical protein
MIMFLGQGNLHWWIARGFSEDGDHQISCCHSLRLHQALGFVSMCLVVQEWVELLVMLSQGPVDAAVPVTHLVIEQGPQLVTEVKGGARQRMLYL